MNKKELFGYSLGGIGHNLIYALFSGYLLIFYTDVFELPASYVAMLFLVARILDTVNDPIMGVIADKTKSRLGHYRIWLMVASPVIALSLIMCFSAPSVSEAVKGIYCYISYILLGMAFTAADIPYWALPSVMTADAEQRARIFSAGSIAGCLASGIGAVVVPMIVSSLGDAKTGYLVCAIAFSVIGIICYMICGAMTRERLSITREHYSFSTAVKSLVLNKPLMILMFASLFGNLAFQVKVSINAYYGQYTLGSYDYITLLSAMLLVGMLIGSVLVPVLVHKFGSKAAMCSMFAAGIILSLAYYAVGYSNLIVVLVFSALSAIVIGALAVLFNSVTADTIDYAEAKTGQRNEGIITSTRTFVSNCATAIAGSLCALALDLVKYVPNVEQTPYVKQAFHAFMSLAPAALYAIALCIMVFYPLSKKRFEALQAELAEKRG